MSERAYWNLLDALQEHPTFANCTNRKCKECAEIKRLGKIAYLISIEQFDVPTHWKDFSVNNYEELVEGEISDKEICEHYNISQGVLSRWKKKNQIDNRRKKISHGTKLMIFDLQKQGFTHKEISKKTGVETGSISNILTKQTHIFEEAEV